MLRTNGLATAGWIPPGLARSMRQMRASAPREPLHKRTGRLHARWAVTGAANYAKPG
jgi:hypothetical protein